MPTYTRNGLCHVCVGDKGSWKTPAQADRIERDRSKAEADRVAKRRALWVKDPEPQEVGETPAWMLESGW